MCLVDASEIFKQQKLNICEDLYDENIEKDVDVNDVSEELIRLQLRPGRLHLFRNEFFIEKLDEYLSALNSFRARNSKNSYWTR